MSDSVLRFNSANLHELPIDLPEPHWPVVMVTARKHSLNPVVERFIETAREVAKAFGHGRDHPEASVKKSD